MLDKYGLRMIGISAAAKETQYTKYGLHTVISYDMDTGDIYADTYPDCNTWAEYKSPSVMDICRTDRPLTRQKIADLIAEAMVERCTHIDRRSKNE